MSAMNEREKCKDRERKALRLLQKSLDEDGEVQDFAALKQIKRAAESDEKKRAARLKQQEIFISQWPELAIID